MVAMKKLLAVTVLACAPALMVACGALGDVDGVADAGEMADGTSLGSDGASDRVAVDGDGQAQDASTADTAAEANSDAPDGAAEEGGPNDAGDAAARDVTFAVVGDFGSGSAREAAVAAMIASWAPDFVVTTGDNNYGTAAELGSYDPNVGQFYHPFIAPYTGVYGAPAAQNAFFPAIGNHDWDIGGGAPYFDFFTLPGNERYYELARGSARFVFLDSDTREPDGRTPGSVQGAWAEARMALATEPFVFVVFHHPAYTSGGREPAMLWPFKAWGADAVLTGHVHNYERLTDVGLTYFVNGQGGHSTHAFGAIHPASQFRYNAQDGAQLVTVSATKATFRYYGVDGTLVDIYAMDASGQPVPP